MVVVEQTVKRDSGTGLTVERGLIKRLKRREEVRGRGRDEADLYQVATLASTHGTDPLGCYNYQAI